MTEGSLEGSTLGDDDGVLLGLNDGPWLGIVVGIDVGELLGFEDGSELGALLGTNVGVDDGTELGIDVGLILGSIGLWMPPPHTQHAIIAVFPFDHTSAKSLQKLDDKSLHPLLLDSSHM